MPIKTVVLVGFALCQVGEFSFILSEVGLEHGLLSGDSYQYFLSVTILTMLATPFVIMAAPRFAEAVARLPWPRRLKTGLRPQGSEERKPRLKDHLVIIGFGVGGRNVAAAAKAAKIKYMIVEMNPETVLREKARGEPIFFGDAGYDAVLEHAGVDRARVLVVTVPDVMAVRGIVDAARKLNPSLHIIARTRFMREIETLLKLGADEVVTEEFESAIEIFTMVLLKYLTPREEIEGLIARAREDGYEMLRSPARGKASLADLNIHLSDYEINTFRVCEKSRLLGRTLAQLQLRKNYGVTLLAVKRGGEVMTNPDVQMELALDDILVLIGKPDKIVNVVCELNAQRKRKG